MEPQKLFVDLFAGCGGLSLGLLQAGWNGLFAVEKTEDAFKTLAKNLCQTKKPYCFDWPAWLPLKARTTASLLRNYNQQLSGLSGKVDLIAGGPPCQGFSFAGRRNSDDPRNELTNEYIRIVKLIKPKLLLIENVRGFDAAFPGKRQSYAQLVQKRLTNLRECGYNVFSKVLLASEFGVPQPRRRFILIAIRKDLSINDESPFDLVAKFAKANRKKHGLGERLTTVRDAIGDLSTRGRRMIDCEDSKGFKQIAYRERKNASAFQSLMRKGIKKGTSPNSLRIPNHRDQTVKRFQEILEACPKGKSLSDEFRTKFGMKKQCFTPLHPNKLATTVTTLPDDVLHYSEPRILTVRENARLQTFPDWFEFQGRYTTGGQRRKHECPRYSQVGNAVPPLMAKAIGSALLSLLNEYAKKN